MDELMNTKLAYVCFTVKKDSRTVNASNNFIKEDLFLLSDKKTQIWLVLD